MRYFLLIPCVAIAIALLTSNSNAAQILHYWDFESGFSDTVGTGGGTPGSEVSTGTGYDGNTAGVFPGSPAGGGPFGTTGRLDTDGVNISGPFAFSWWFNISNDQGTSPRGFFDFSSNGGDGPQSLYIGNNDRIAFRMDGVGGGGAALYDNNGAGFEDGLWHFVVANYDPVTGITLHVDGPEIDATTGGFGDAVGGWNTDQYLGAFNIGPTTLINGLDGSLDDLAIYSGNLNATQIGRLFEGGLQPTQIPEPSSLITLIAGISLLVLRPRKRN